MDHNHNTVQTYNSIAQQYQDVFMNLALYNDTYDALVKLLPIPDATIIDIACGPGNITRYLLAKLPKAQIWAIDQAPNMVNLAKQNNPAATIGLMDARKINQLSFKYHAVVAGFLIPYLSLKEVEALILNVSGILLPNGLFYLSFIEGDYEKSGYQTNSNGLQPMFIYYYPINYLELWLAQNNLIAVHVMRKYYSRLNKPSETHIIIIARSKIAV